jgi:hypothetical protein
MKRAANQRGETRMSGPTAPSASRATRRMLCNLCGPYFSTVDGFDNAAKKSSQKSWVAITDYHAHHFLELPLAALSE